MALTSTQEAVANQVLDDLYSSLYSAWSEVSSSSSLYSGSVRETVLANLDADKKRIERLDGELLDQVRAGALAFSNWAAIAKITHEDIAYQVGLTGSWSFTGVLSAAVAETYNDVVDGVKDTVASVGGGAGIGAIAGFLLVIALAVKFK